ncbi:MAG: MBL fold metallo-hydrolase [Thermoplasmata archaeon]|nr:MAG: MBL fold metallo-hydrolase [Thermoplasmata archaeon]
MKIKIVYDNTAYRDDMKADWGFSAYIEDFKLLFDTGARGDILLSNMEKMGLDANDIKEVFISHGHWDHTGGLGELLNLNNELPIYVPFSYKPKAKNVVSIKEATKIHDNIFSTGELAGIEQSMVILDGKKAIVMVGCSHPGVRRILEEARKFGEPYALIGGLHGFNEYEVLEPLEMIVPTHCTQHKKEIKELYPEKYMEGGAGRIIEI